MDCWQMGDGGVKSGVQSPESKVELQMDEPLSLALSPLVPRGEREKALRPASVQWP